jgi:parallel beta-helix repeat protein
MYKDVTNPINQFNSSIDIVFGDSEFKNSIQSKYNKILYWPNDFGANMNFQVTNIDNGLGYSSIQDSMSSFATYQGATVLVKPGTYQENIVITKPVLLISQNEDALIRTNMLNTTLLTIVSDNVTVTVFRIQNNGIFSIGAGGGILLDNAHNCSLIRNTVIYCFDGLFLNNSSSNLFKNNVIQDNYHGIVLNNSSENTFRGNNLNNNAYNLVLQNGLLNDLDPSNIVDGKPYSAR